MGYGPHGDCRCRGSKLTPAERFTLAGLVVTLAAGMTLLLRAVLNSLETAGSDMMRRRGRLWSQRQEGQLLPGSLQLQVTDSDSRKSAAFHFICSCDEVGVGARVSAYVQDILSSPPSSPQHYNDGM